MGGSKLTDLTPRPPLLHRVTPKQLQMVDFGVAALLVLVTTLHAMGQSTAVAPIGGLGRGVTPNSGPLINNVSEVYLALAVGLAVAIRRRLPLIALLMATVTVVIAIGTPFSLTWLPEICLAIPVYQVASLHARRESVSALALVFLALCFSSLGRFTANPAMLPALGLVAAVTSWFVGDSVRVRHLYMAGLSEQAAQHQREAIERAQRSVAEERLQIARELHDVVAHSLSVIAVQSGVGRHVIDGACQPF
jgi:signal transduction histidine kinase